MSFADPPAFNPFGASATRGRAGIESDSEGGETVVAVVFLLVVT
jgi:hypothetical protein